MAQSPLSQAIEVFICYSQQDEEWRKVLQAHLAILNRQGKIVTWHQGEIGAGTEWSQEITARLESAQIILLLISSDFIASDCYEQEMRRALERHSEGTAWVIPILLRPVDWQGAPFSHLRVLPANEESISTWSNRDAACLSVTQGVRRVVELLRDGVAVGELERHLPRDEWQQGSSEEAQSSSPLVQPFGVPYSRNSLFTGREGLLDQLHQQLSQQGKAAINQVQGISGLGGIGKTQTAVEYAYRSYYDQPFYDWVFWVRAETEVGLKTNYAALAQQLHLPTASLELEEQIQAVQSWLNTHERWLLIIDNADEPAVLQAVRSLLPRNPQGRVLITSRIAVLDQVGIIAPLSLPPLIVEDAVNFLLKRVNRDPSASEKQSAAELAAELGGLPLALEQAGAFILRRKLSFASYLSLYCKRQLQLLEQGKPQLGDYPASVLTTWSLNFQAVEQMNASAAEVLRLSSFVAPDAIPYELLLRGAEHLGEVLATALQAETDEEAELAITELLEPLQQYSLIQWEPESYCYSMHRLVQAVLRDGMEAQTQRLWGERLVQALDAVFPNVTQFDNWDDCARLLLHALAVIEAANQQRQESEALALLLNEIGYYLNEQGRYEQAEPLFQQALEMRQRLLGAEHPSVATSLNNLALLYDSQGRYEQAEPLYQQALEMKQRLLGPEHPSVATSLNNLALLYDSQGRYEQAEPLYLQALAILYPKLGENHPTVRTVLSNFFSCLQQAVAAGQETMLSDHPLTQHLLQQITEMNEEQ